MNSTYLPKFDIMDYHFFTLPFYNTAYSLSDGTITNEFNVALNPTDKEGLIVKVSNSKFRILLGAEYEPYLYRGENSKFDYFQPSLQRYDFLSPEYCLAWIKKEQFKEGFKQTAYYNELLKLKVLDYSFDFDLEAIAQHYDFKTNYIDVTRNRDVAEFFAYTYWDKNHKCYKPITANYSPRIYRAKMADVIQYNSKIFQIVGFQACLRPLKQQAMALDLSNGNTSIRDDLFETIILENSEEKAKTVFDKFDGGKLLFPTETIIDLKNKIEDPKTFLSEYCVQKYAETFKVPYHKVATKLRKNFEIKIKDKYLHPSPDLSKYMLQEFNREIKPWIETKTGFRLATRI